MFFEQTKKNYTYLTLGLFLCAILLVGLGYTFVQHLEIMYEDQAKVTLHATASNVAHFYNYNVDESLEHLDALAKNPKIQDLNSFKVLNTQPNILDNILQNFPFIGIITHDNQVHISAQDGKEVYLDTVSQNKLLLSPKRKNLYAIAYTDGKGEYFSFYTTPLQLNNGQEALLFAAKSYSSVLQNLFPPTLSNHMRYVVINQQGDIVEGTFNSMTLGENFLDILSISPQNTPEVIAQLRQDMSLSHNSFAQIAMNGHWFYVSLVPTKCKQWTVGVFVASSTAQRRLENMIYVLMGIGSAWFIFCIITLLHVVRTQRQQKKVSEYAAQRLQWLFDQSPCGVVRFNDDEKWTILEYGNSFLSTIGITARDLRKKYNNSWAELIHPDDLHTVQENLRTALANGEEIVILEYRLKNVSNTPIWILESVRLIEEEAERWYWSTIINITERKTQELRDLNMTVRYRYLFEASENILYEYSWHTQKLRATAQFFKKFGYPLPEVKADYYNINLDIIHPEDMDLFQSMQAKLKAGGNSVESLLRLKNAHNSWIWCQLRQNAWTDMTTNETKVIGEIKNVDEETRCLQKLRDDVQRDAFTGLYNKTASTELIQQAVLGNQGERGVLCIIDVDNFKHVNDNLGHAVGDLVIKNLAAGLAGIFRSDDIVGRMGGDEYIVYLKNMPNLGVLLVKLDKVIEFFKQTLEGEGVVVKISCSIGIALFPTDADNYEDLYTRADKALYRSKKKKGIYTFYDAKIDN